MVTIIVKMLTLATFNIDASAVAIKAICDKLSPTKEYLFNTRVTPNKEDDIATKTLTIKAYCTKG